MTGSTQICRKALWSTVGRPAPCESCPQLKSTGQYVYYRLHSLLAFDTENKQLSLRQVCSTSLGQTNDHSKASGTTAKNVWNRLFVSIVIENNKVRETRQPVNPCSSLFLNASAPPFYDDMAHQKVVHHSQEQAGTHNRSVFLIPLCQPPPPLKTDHP